MNVDVKNNGKGAGRRLAVHKNTANEMFEGRFGYNGATLFDTSTDISSESEAG